MPKIKSNIKTASVLTVGQMIDSAFGNVDVNIVNFKMLQTIIVLLANQLRLLNRQVALESDSLIPTSNTNTVVTEIKIKNPTKKSKRELDPHTTKSYDGHEFRENPNEPRETVSRSRGAVNDKNFATKETKLSTSRFDDQWSSGNSVTQSPIKSENSSLRAEKYYEQLDRLEEEREKVLRIIQERKESHDEGVMMPSPMASLPSTEFEFQKLFIVEQKEGKEDKRRKLMPFVTWDQFDELKRTVHKIEGFNFGTFGSLYFPDNIQLMQELRKGASLTEAMAALQISSRLDVAEKALGKLAAIIGKVNTQELSMVSSVPEAITPHDTRSVNHSQYVTKSDLQTLLDAERTAVLTKVNNLNQRVNNMVGTTSEQARKLDTLIGDSIKIKEKVEDMEKNINGNSQRLNMVDASLTSQMTMIQEQIAQAQVLLETGLCNMNESLTNKGVDNEVLAEIDRKISVIQMSVDRTGSAQRDLHDNQKQLTTGIDRLMYDVEMLRDSKCDRDEVIDALRDKAGLQDLNGMVSEEQFMQSYTALQNGISDVYGTFNKQEIVWQKALNDIFDQLDNKIDRYMFTGLRDDINIHLNSLNEEIDTLKKIVGEPLAASTSRRIYRDTTCLSCANPANISPDTVLVPTFPPLRPPGVGNENRSSKNNRGDLETHSCASGLKITHPLDPRADKCTRYCGGAYTKKHISLTHKTNKMHLVGKPLLEPVLIDTITTDGRQTYQTIDDIVQKPCLPCNQEYGAGKGTFKGSNEHTKNYSIYKRSNSSKQRCVYDEESPIPKPTPTLDDMHGMIFPSFSVSSVYS